MIVLKNECLVVVVGIVAPLFAGILPVQCLRSPSSNSAKKASSPPRRQASVASSPPVRDARGRRPFLQNGWAAMSAALIATIPPEPALAGIDVSGLPVEGQQKGTRTAGQPISATVTPSSANGGGVQTIELAGISYTPAAMILQMAEQTASMEGMARASAKDIRDGKTKTERFENGSRGAGPGVVRRQDLTRSVQVMLANSKLSRIAPAAGDVLEGIPSFLARDGAGDADVSSIEYEIVASKYEAARGELQKAFQRMSPEEQAEGQRIVRAIRAKDMERMEQQRNQ